MRFNFLTLPDYSSVALSGAIEVLCLANQLCRQPVYSWELVSLNGASVRASNGQCVEPTAAVSKVAPADIIFVCKCTHADSSLAEEALRSLQPDARQVMLDSLGEGVDLLLTLIREQQGEAIASEISCRLNLCRVRGLQNPQTLPTKASAGAYRQNLMEVIDLMETNLNEPLPLDDISRLVGISLRQIERQFRTHLGDTPSKYYLRKRLQKARNLLLQTAMPVMAVSQACGFESSQHFSKRYRRFFGKAPSEERL